MPISQLHQRLSDFKTLVANNVQTIRTAGKESWHGITFSNGEVQIVHDYLHGVGGSGLAHLNIQIPPLFRSAGFEVKFAGVFCHGQPYVQPYAGRTLDARMPAASPCELGDLYVVFVFLDAGKNLRQQRSFLFQAKKEKPRMGAKSLISSANQSYLYEEADSFDYTTMLSGQSRNWPKYEQRERALHYLFCGSANVQTSSACAPALVAFEELLLRFLGDSEGLFFRLVFGWKPSPYSDWWQINDDLLHAIAIAYYSRTQRGSADLADVLNHFNDFSDPKEYFVDLGERPAIPTLFVIVRDRELKPE